MSLHKNRVKMTVSGTPGAGTVTLGSASTAYQSFASAYGANATVDVLYTDAANAWGIERDCAYTHSGTTLGRGTYEASSTGSNLTLTSAAVVSVILSAGAGQQLALDHVALADANTTMVVGSMYVGSMAAWATADRTYTLPASANVGDRIGVMITGGNATYELIIKPDASDTLNGGSAGAEWSRLFISNETVIMRCVTANSAWVVEQDGRIPQQGIVRVTTAGTTNTGASQTSPSAMGGYAGTADLAVGCTVSTANFSITSRRVNKIDLQFFWLSQASVTSATESLLNLIRSGSVSVTQFRVVGGSTNLVGLSGSGSVLGVVDEVFELRIRTSGTNNTGCAIATFLAMTEVL
jgi:hypothetical protein